MFERLVTQVLHGYLGRYVKDFHKHQLKITIWNEEVFLENVELSLEAFDYLQLPFALKQGRIGKISIRIPWKRLGREPFVISLENVFFCASHRDDEEWSMDEVEKREFAAKKAKLAAAELAKLSKRVCENQAGYMSIITAKVIDTIQLSIRDFHMLYHDKLSGSVCNIFGLKFSSLRTMKQNPSWSVAIGIGGQVNKTVEIMGLEFYCGALDGAVELMNMENSCDSTLWQDTTCGKKRYNNSILSPCDVSMSLLVNKSGELSSKIPQYSITAEVTDMVMSIDEVQLQHILFLWDYFCTCELRNTYGRYRPWSSPLSKKIKGWQKLWWRYVQESILSDVRKRLKKTSWRHFGQRLSSCRKYVKLYKRKLDFLRHDQPIDESTRWELEQMEKELGIDDILSYRSAAECESQELLVTTSTGKSRGWLNWLSLGMLGAGGTNVSDQFSGAVSVSDAAIKDIYEATEFDPPIISNGVASTNEKIDICALQFNINRISATLRNMKYGQEIAELILDMVTVECKFREESAAIVATVKLGEMVYPCNKKRILLLQGPSNETNEVANETPSFSLQVDASSDLEAELSIKGMLQPFEVTIDAVFCLMLMDFLGALNSIESQHERVLMSLIGIENVNGRLLSKAEYILSRHKKVLWDVTIMGIVINVPWGDSTSESHNLVLEAGSLLFLTKSDLGSKPYDDEEQFYSLKNLLASVSSCNLSPCFHIQDIYNHYEVKLNELELKVTTPSCSFPISILEKVSASVSFSLCLIQDESVPKQLEACVILSSLHAHFSPSIYAAILGLVENLGAVQSKFDSLPFEPIDSLKATSNGLETPVFGFSSNINLETVTIEVKLESEQENSSSIMLKFQQLDICYSLSHIEKCWIIVNAFSVTASDLAGRSDSLILYTSGDQSPTNVFPPHEIGDDYFYRKAENNQACFTFHYESHLKEPVSNKCRICFNNGDFHCYPYVIGHLVAFFNRLSAYGSSDPGKNTSSSYVDAGEPKSVPGYGFQRFGFTNFVETGSSECASIPVDQFPFVMLSGVGSLGNLESSLAYASPEWRKYFSVKDCKISSPQSNSKAVSNVFHVPAKKSQSAVEASAVYGSSGTTSSFLVIDVSLCGLKVHFHDSKCIVGTIILPRCNSSVSIFENYFDVLCSSEGLVLSSSWSSQNIREFLWGPSISNISPVLNVRVRRRESGPLSSRIELCFSVQHVYCILPPEYLAILIGYFSLSDWSSHSNDKLVTIGHEDIESENKCSFVYKFEILDSVLIVPVQSLEGQFLKCELEQFYCTFIQNSLNNLLKDIPYEYRVAADKLAKRNHSLNLFGRDLLLSFICFKDNEYSSFMDVPLIAPLCADVWVDIPCEDISSSQSSPSNTCVMIRVGKCQLKPKDDHFLQGFQELADIINQFSVVTDLSECFKTDVLQFLQLKRSLEQNSADPPVVSSVNCTEVRCFVNSLSIQLNSWGVSEDPIATAEMKLVCSVSLRNDTLLSVALNFSCLELSSFPGSVVLARCNSTSVTSSVLDFFLAQEKDGVNEVRVSLPSVEMWLHISYWTEVIDLIKSYAVQSSSPSLPDNSEKGTDALTVRSENICITLHFPVWNCDRDSGEDHGCGSMKDLSNIVDVKAFKSVAVTLCSRSSDLFVDAASVKVKSDIEKVEGMVCISQNGSVHSTPVFQISQVLLVANFNTQELLYVEGDVQCDDLDVWVSHNILYFLHGVHFDFVTGGSATEGGNSQLSFGRVVVGVHLRKASFLLSDGRWSCSGPLFQILMRDVALHANATDTDIECSVSGDLQVNYNNIHKVFWEPFIEPWRFEANMIRKQEMSLSSSNMTDIHLKSFAHLNVNFTESLIECIFRTVEMIQDAYALVSPNDLPESQKLLHSPFSDAGKYAPYVLQNLTSLPLTYHVCQGPFSPDEFPSSEMTKKFVHPGSSVPIYINDTPEKQLIHAKPAHFSERIFDQKVNGVRHQYISIQLAGMSVPSEPISMDLVGLAYFEVDFSMSYNDNMENHRSKANAGFVVPVVFDVSVQRYSKLIRLYSTVILLNATSMPLELRFDIPFGVAPKILDPIYPGQELPLPLHLAEAGRIRWRPIGNSHLWSEVYDLSNLLSQEGKIGFLKSFACYPAHPNSDPFRSCISVRNISIPSPVRLRKSSIKQTVASGGQLFPKDEAKKQFIHQVVLSIPLVVNNYLPDAVTLTIESGGITRTTFLSEVETYFHNVDPSHQLRLEIHINGFETAILDFPRTELFCKKAKFAGTKFSLSEVVPFNRDSKNGPVYVTVEKVMDAFSGARELFMSVPFLLYNCTGFPLFITESSSDMKEDSFIVPSCYDMDEQELLQGNKDGLGLVSSNYNPNAREAGATGSSSGVLIVSIRGNVATHKGISSSKPLYFGDNFNELSSQCNVDRENSVFSGLQKRSKSTSQLTSKDLHSSGYERSGRVKACMFSHSPISSAGEVMVRVSRCIPGYVRDNMPNSLWSSTFSLIPPSGSTTVLVPQSSTNQAFMMSITSSAVAAPFAGRTSAITFQPRYIISNACSKNLCYKQKGTEISFGLGAGEHSHLHWMDTTRELLVSIRYNEPGWQWSGGFLPDHLGDTQVKMRNYLSGSLNMVRVEVQNADVSLGDEQVVGNFHGNSGTNLILISDDETGYMPYRVDNFSNERLRIYQQKCETLETIVQSYTSCPYAWDEPCYPHRLTIEVPGKRVLGSYALDDLKPYSPVQLPSSPEKPERTLHISIHVEGATKVMRVIDSSYHVLNENKSPSCTKNKGNLQQKHDKFIGFMERFSFVIEQIGISLINIHPQELLFVCANGITADLVQSSDQQKVSFQIDSLQIDNQLRSSPYPVMLSFDREHKSKPAGNLIREVDMKPSERISKRPSHNFEPVFCLAISKWRKKDVSLVSFEYISLRVADARLELEQELILSLFGFVRNVTSRFQSRVLTLSDPFQHPLNDAGSMDSYANDNQVHVMIVPLFSEYHKQRLSLPSIVPIGAPWQQIYRLARRQKKIYVEVFELSPIKLTLSFSSTPWMLRNGILAAGESVIHRGLMALADVEGARIHLKQFTIAHQIASLESLQEIVMRHYTRQLLHEMYKVFGSAGVIGNPMGFARSVGLGIRDFLSVPARSIFQSPTGLITGMAQGTTSLLSNTVYAISDAATQFSKAAHKGIVAFTFDDKAVSEAQQQQTGIASHSKGVINEVFEGLTGLLQSPINGAEKHGLPGVLSGIALGITGLVAKPAASILEVTGKTAQSIRNRSRIYQGQQRFRVRLPRPLSQEYPLRTYCWEEAIGASALIEADGSLTLKDEIFVTCKKLKEAGKFVIVTERLVLIVSCSSLVDLGKPEFRGVSSDLNWVIESEIHLENVIHADSEEAVVHIVGSSSNTPLRQNQLAKSTGTKAERWINPTAPLIQTNLELEHKEDAENLLLVLSSTIELGKDQGWGYRNILHRSNIKVIKQLRDS